MNVWYVSYGSNICYDRFLCYIIGEKPTGSDKKEKGCRDQTTPKANEKIEIPYPLYFAKEKSKWGAGGVAFIDYEKLNDHKTYGRMYLITEEQFIDVVAQENDQEKINIDLQEVIKNGFSTINDGWYGRIMYLGVKDGAPMFTFTSNQQIENATFNVPTSSYLKTIARGLIQVGLSHSEIVEYFLKQHGIKGHFTNEELFEYIFPTLKFLKDQ
ncbi:hypothetical protein ACQKP0_14680 [Heyndrickxia sp. NPDC080065]|uniref:hypothetical protein n=1 Tax=Heyndrickxia sp. NPDC080065 TaxID=3390568 RepID=UPI003D08D049